MFTVLNYRTWSTLYGDQDTDMLSANSEASVSPLPADEEMVTGPRSLQTNPGAPSPTPSSGRISCLFGFN